MDTHFFGTLAVTRAFAPQLATQHRSAMLNILSVLSWLSIPRSGAYSAAKSAEWSLTNALRLELAPQGTRVTALHVGYMDTDMTRHLDVPESDPAVIAKLAIDGIAAGDAEIIADETTRRVLAGLSAGVADLYPRSPDPADHIPERRAHHHLPPDAGHGFPLPGPKPVRGRSQQVPHRPDRRGHHRDRQLPDHRGRRPEHHRRRTTSCDIKGHKTANYRPA
jgi:hypothetical protein